MNRRRLYLLLSGLCLAGYGWVARGFFYGVSGDSGFCLFRAVTGIPCPSCGSTRSVISVLHGDIAGSVHWNILGWLMLTALLVLPVWIFYDLVRGRDTLFPAYRGAERILRMKRVALPAILLLLANWIWVILKIG